MPHLAVQRIAKSYDGNPAVRDISFEVAPGRVLALCGENGAGKSTLMRMLSGATLPGQRDDPARRRAGATIAAAGGRDGARDLHGLPGAEPASASQRRRERAARADADPRAAVRHRLARQPTGSPGGCSPISAFPTSTRRRPVGSLSVARQQIVEIAKALVTEPRILILDEPTAVLSAVGDRAALRQGAAASPPAARPSSTSRTGSRRSSRSPTRSSCSRTARACWPRRWPSSTTTRIIRAMVGRPLSAVFPPARRRARPAWCWRSSGLGQRGRFEDVSFAVRAGEIVGMFGLVGSGRTEVAKAIFGARPADAGTVRLGGRDARFATPAEAVRSGVAMLTEDRKGDGLVLDLSVLDNAGLASFAALLAPRRHRRPAARGAGRRQDRRAVGPAARHRPAGAPALRRQPAEGGARQVAPGRGHRALHLRRADPRRRRRHPGRDLPDDPRPRRPPARRCC